MIYLELQSL